MAPDMSLTGKFGRYARGITAKGRKDGAGAALRLGLGWAVAFTRKQLLRLWESAHDALTGFDTVADHPEIERPKDAAHGDAVFYAPVPPTVFGGMVKDLAISPTDFTFVDLGCGKGAALLQALDHGFERALGVELNQRLVPIAQQNVAKYLARNSSTSNVEVIHGDVIAVDFPKSPLVVFLYNPFGSETLKAVLGNLESSLRRTPRQAVVAYASPVHADQLDACSWLQRSPSRSPRWAIYRTRDFA